MQTQYKPKTCVHTTTPHTTLTKKLLTSKKNSSTLIRMKALHATANSQIKQDTISAVVNARK